MYPFYGYIIYEATTILKNSHGYIIYEAMRRVLMKYKVIDKLMKMSSITDDVYDDIVVVYYLSKKFKV